MVEERYGYIESHMLAAMDDPAHDRHHIYRVLNNARAIARNHAIDVDVLIAACLLHDIGRSAQYKDPSVCHAKVGAAMAFEFLIDCGWPVPKAEHVRDCIATHRFRTDIKPDTLEAKILFDADKLDVTGALGVCRSLIYIGQIGQPLYTVDETGAVQLGAPDDPDSFVKEYHKRLERLYNGFYTPEAQAIAARRKGAMVAFYEALIEEIGG